MKQLFWVLCGLQAQGLYIRAGSALIEPRFVARWLKLDDTTPAEYRPLTKPGKPLEYATKVGDVYVSGGTVLHVYKPEGTGTQERDRSNDDWARD